VEIEKLKSLEDKKMRKNYQLKNTMPLPIKKAGAVSIPNYNVQNYKPNGIHAIMQSSIHEISLSPTPHYPSPPPDSLTNDQ
jgi:hypothetical protein